jgi:hypothetical protein
VLGENNYLLKREKLVELETGLETISELVGQING